MAHETNIEQLSRGQQCTFENTSTRCLVGHYELIMMNEGSKKRVQIWPVS